MDGRHPVTRVGLALTAVAACAAALSAGPVVFSQLSGFARLGGSSSSSSTGALGSADYFPETVYLAVGPLLFFFFKETVREVYKYFVQALVSYVALPEALPVNSCITVRFGFFF